MTSSPTVQDVLLTRRGLLYPESQGPPLPSSVVQAVGLELAALGYVLSSRLSERLGRCSLDELTSLRSWALASLLAQVGGDQKHEPLFRRFPQGVPDDTEALWWSKVLVHFCQAEDQPCLRCGRVGTTHVLDPCRHVICDRCFDGSNYSACPVCEHQVDRRSPFFRPAPPPQAKPERVRFRLLDLGEDARADAKALFLSLAARAQALSPADRDVLRALIHGHRGEILAWLPAEIPVRENVAIIFGTLFSAIDPAEVLPVARRFMTTATDVLRFIAVLSGTDGALQAQTVFRQVAREDHTVPFWQKIAKLLGAAPPSPRLRMVRVPVQVKRFKTAKLPRPLRRALLEILEGIAPDRLIEDMLRHRSYWVWVGEFLHPHEHKKRYPAVARAFEVVRKKGPDGVAAPRFQGTHARFEAAVGQRDAEAALAVLEGRPGEIARRLDHLLRLSQSEAARQAVSEAFSSKLPALATPLLLTLHSHLPRRTSAAPVRVYWPRSAVALGVSAPDRRPPLLPEVVEPLVAAIDAELLRRFASKPAFDWAILDAELRSIIVPFNERTASRSAITLPRGSRLTAPEGKLLRLFLHWCQPEENATNTDLDLSVAFYDESWRYLGLCSYSQLKWTGEDGSLLAQSAGDLRNAPWPDGATELIDLHTGPAREAGTRYAVMVINAYAGMPFSQLARGFAGVMLRDHAEGLHFDPATVELRFSLEGENGIYLPLVLDLKTRDIHWLDVHAKGMLEMNNVASSKKAIATVCPALMRYFGSGARASLFDLGALHAAARCRRVFVRGEHGIHSFLRRPEETALAFYRRIGVGHADEPRARLPEGPPSPALAFLLRGDLELPEGSGVYALIRTQTLPNLAASDLLS